jgi:hypothetical protein
LVDKIRKRYHNAHEKGSPPFSIFGHGSGNYFTVNEQAIASKCLPGFACPLQSQFRPFSLPVTGSQIPNLYVPGKVRPEPAKSQAFCSLVTLVGSNETGFEDIVLWCSAQVSLVVLLYFCLACHFRTPLQWFFVCKGRILKRHYAVLDVSKAAILPLGPYALFRSNESQEAIWRFMTVRAILGNWQMVDEYIANHRKSNVFAIIMEAISWR